MRLKRRYCKERHRLHKDLFTNDRLWKSNEGLHLVPTTVNCNRGCEGRVDTVRCLSISYFELFYFAFMSTHC